MAFPAGFFNDLPYFDHSCQAVLNEKNIAVEQLADGVTL